MARLEQMGVEAIIKNLPQYLKGMDKMGKSTEKTQGIIGKIGGIAKGAIGGLFKIGLAAGAAAIGGVAALGGALFKLASDAAPIAGIKASFEDLTASMEGGSKAVLAALKEQSAGLITNTDLMKSFNLASLLIGESFTEQLPDAMKFVGKVALATGEDMGFLMDSLVRGVGRLSPMILDNLGITVNLTEAYEAWSKENGVAVSEMSKVQQQAAVMAQTMSKLEEKTANMPDVAGSAQQAFGSFGVMMKNFKDELGLAVLPSITKLMGIFSKLAAKVLPKIVDFFKMKVVPILEKFGEILKKLTTGEFKFENILPPFVLKIWEGLIEVVDKFRKWWDRNGPFIMSQAKRIFGTIIDTISKLAESIIPWVVEQFGKISAWFDEHEDDIKGAIKSIADFFENTLGPAVTTLWTNVLQPFFGDFIDGLLKVGGAILEFLGGGRETFFDVGLNVESLGPKKKGDIGKLFNTIGEALETFLTETLPTLWINFRDWVLGFLDTDWESVVASWQDVWDLLGIIVETKIAEIKTLIEEFKAFYIDFANDISLLLRAVSGDPAAILDLIGGEFGPNGSGVQPTASPITEPTSTGPIMLPPVAPLSNAGNNYNLTINTSAPVEPIVEDFRLMRAMGGRP